MNFRNIDDLPGDLDELNFGLAVLRAEHAAWPFDDIVENGGVFALTSEGELRGTLPLELLARIGGTA